MRIKRTGSILILLMFMICWGLMSCKTAVITKSVKREEVKIKDIKKADLVQKKEVQNIWVKKIQGKFIWNNKEQSFKASYKIKRDSIVMISLMNPLGIEALRIVCKTDSFGFIDRINKNYFSDDYNTIRKKIGYKIDLYFIQAVLLNEIVTLNQNTTREFFNEQKKLVISNNSYSTSMNGTSLDEKNNEKKINYFLKFETENLRVVYSVISDFLGKNIIEIIYGDYEMTGGNKFPGNMKISIASKGINLSCTMKMERVLVNTDFGINYIVNPKYKRIDW